MRTRLLFFTFLSAVRLTAQVASATLLGEIQDESGALAPAVTITARQDSTGFVRTAVTNTEGAYRIDDLIPGKYTIIVRKSGFRTLESKDVSLAVNQKARLDMVLKVGGERDSVTVQARVSLVQGDDATVGYRLESTN